MVFPLFPPPPKSLLENTRLVIIKQAKIGRKEKLRERVSISVKAVAPSRAKQVHRQVFGVRPTVKSSAISH